MLVPGQHRAAAQGYTTASQLLDYFHVRWQKTLLAAGRLPMFWDEFFWVYDAPTPTRTNLTVLPGTTASLRGGWRERELWGGNGRGGRASVLRVCLSLACTQ